ncbi:hypothetical protein LCGC14_1391840 [marine sediment metagenome]|uniref:CR-type domain-containing protein n=1 Tax=marine sediment metagenome TaxID=412755 RepID=A0A0F9KKK5_9ZZZZ
MNTDKLIEEMAEFLFHLKYASNSFLTAMPELQKYYKNQAKQLAQGFKDHKGVFKVERKKPCTRCKGSGLIETGILRGGVFRGKDIDCPDCKGAGKRVKVAIEELEIPE